MQRKKPDFIGPEGKFKLNLPFSVKLPGWLRGCVVVVLVLLLAAVTLYSVLLEYIEPNEYGVLEVQIGVNRGIREEWYGPGYAFVMPRFQKVHRLPRNVQVLELTDVTSRNPRAAAGDNATVAYDRAAKIQTSDGFSVAVDVTILYRIVDPYKVVTTLGPGMQYLEAGIRPKAEPVLKQALGELTTEEFYNSPMRVAKAEKARDLLDGEMVAKGIEVDQVLVRYFKYSDRIQQNIEDKKLQDQLVFTNQSKNKAAQATQELNRVQMEGEMKVVVTLEEGEAYKVKKDAEKELYVRSKQAEADLLIELAEAERARLRNDAMQVLGADLMVAMKMAEVLKGIEVILLPTGGEDSVNPLDLEGMLGMFGVGEYPKDIKAMLKQTPKPSGQAPALKVKPPAPPPAPESTAAAGPETAANEEEAVQ